MSAAEPTIEPTAGAAAPTPEPAAVASTQLAAEPAAEPAAAASAHRATSGDLDRRLAARLIDDSLVTLANHLLYYVKSDNAFREKVVRHFDRLGKKQAAPVFFVQAFHAYQWSPIEAIKADDPVVAKLYPHAGSLAKQLADSGTQSFVMLIDYAHPAAVMMNVRAAIIMKLWLNADGSKPRPKSTPVEDWVKFQLKNSALIEQSLEFDVMNLRKWALDAQDVLKAALADSLKARRDLSTEYANSLYLSDIREACVRWNIHERVAAADAAAAASVGATPTPTTDGAAPTPSGVAPMLCFQLECGAQGTPKLTQMDAAEVYANIEALRDTPLADHYRAAHGYMLGPRDPGDAVVIVMRGHDGVSTGLCNIACNVIDMRIAGLDVDKERAARKAHAEAIQAEFERVSGKTTK